MTDQRFIIEMGIGNDQYGQDYTKAAARAIEDAIRHSAIPMFAALDMNHEACQHGFIDMNSARQYFAICGNMFTR